MKPSIMKMIICLTIFISGVIVGIGTQCYLNYAKQGLSGRLVLHTVGRTKEEVLAKQGNPTAVVDNVWLYNESSIVFDKDGKTKRFYDADGGLKREPLSDNEQFELLDQFSPVTIAESRKNNNP